MTSNRRTARPGKRLVSGPASLGVGQQLDSIVGRRLTRMLGAIIGAHGIHAGEAVVAEAAKRYALDIPRGWRRMRVEQGLNVGASAYLANHALGGAWLLVGAEVLVGDAHVDLLWASPRGLVVDEIKRHIPAGDLPPMVVRQCQAYVTAGAAQYGDAFLGLRLISLTAIRPTMWFDAQVPDAGKRS